MSIPIKDDQLIQYYNNEQNRQLKSIFVQRISDSSTYVILFPTGLLFMLSTNPLGIQSKMQLNLKRDESILEYSYCISSNFKNQCIWMLDEK